MTLSENQSLLIQQSLPMLREKLRPASMQFYENLFAIAPDMREMFRDDLAGQGMKFLSTLNMIAEHIDRDDPLRADIADLGRSHQNLGVRPEHFAPMGAALMVTLGETLGSDFTDEMRDAWRAAYAEIADRMAAAITNDSLE